MGRLTQLAPFMSVLGPKDILLTLLVGLYLGKIIKLVTISNLISKNIYTSK